MRSQSATHAKETTHSLHNNSSQRIGGSREVKLCAEPRVLSPIRDGEIQIVVTQSSEKKFFVRRDRWNLKGCTKS